MMNFLSLDNAVEVAFGLLNDYGKDKWDEEDKILIEQRMEDKCFISDDQYNIGYGKALEDVSLYLNKLDHKNLTEITGMV